MVEKWTILGYRRCFYSLVCNLSRVQNVGGYQHKFHWDIQSLWHQGLWELYAFKWTTLLILPTTLAFINIVGIVARTAEVIYNGYQALGPFFGKLFFAFWVLVHLCPFLEGLMGNQNRTPTIEIVRSLILASIFSLLWVQVDIRDASQARTLSGRRRRPPPPRGFCLWSRFSWLCFHHFDELEMV